MKLTLLQKENQTTVLEMGIQPEDVFNVLQKVPPHWELESYIAVNPFLGYTNESFEKNLKHLEELLGLELIPNKDLLDGKKKNVSS
jgi:hypothetical protein